MRGGARLTVESDGVFAFWTGGDALGDEAVEAQGPIAPHGLEHLVSSDKGVEMFRALLRKAIQAVQRSEDPKGILRDLATVSHVTTSAGSVVR